MRIIYNGVDLMPLETHEYYWESVYDDSGVDYLYSRVTLVVTALINGFFNEAGIHNGPPMSYNFSEGISTQLSTGTPAQGTRNPQGFVTPNANGIPTSSNANGIIIGTPNQSLRGITLGNFSPITTHKTVRHRLSTPRGQLYVFNGRGMESGNPPAGTFLPPDPAQLSLASPLQGFPTDSKNGPTPKILGITQVMSQDNTFVVDWAVETFVNEAEINNVSPSGGLLSNRFSQSQAVSQDGFTTVTTSGIAIFRTDFVYEGFSSGELNNPDTSRAILFMPIPQGFVREIDYVGERPDVTGIEYSYRDIQKPVNFVAGPYARAAQMVAVHRQAVTSSADILEGALTTYDRINSRILNNKWLRESANREEESGKKSKPSRKGKPSTKPSPKPKTKL